MRKVGKYCTKEMCSGAEPCPFNRLDLTQADKEKIGYQVLMALVDNDTEKLPNEFIRGRRTGERTENSCIHPPRVAATMFAGMNIVPDVAERALEWLVDNEFGTTASINQKPDSK